MEFVFRIPNLPHNTYKAANERRKAMNLTWWAYTVVAFSLMELAPPAVLEKAQEALLHKK